VGNINPYATAFTMITQTLTVAQAMYTSLFNVYFSLSYVTSVQISIIPGGVIGALGTVLKVIGFLPQLFLNIYSLPLIIRFIDPATAIAGFLSDGMAILYAEYYLMVFFAVAAIPVFLIPGVLFRAIFPTRALGGILIAFAFGFYLVMPSMFAVAYYFTAPTVQRDMSLSTLQLQGIAAKPQAAIASSSPIAQQLQSVKSSLNGFWLMIFFYPPLIIAITYAAVQQIANFIGRVAQFGKSMRAFI
jgi:hypothetical protein